MPAVSPVRPLVHPREGCTLRAPPLGDPAPVLQLLPLGRSGNISSLLWGPVCGEPLWAGFSEGHLGAHLGRDF